MILVFYALRREVGGMRRRIAGRSSLSNGLRGFKGRLGAEEIIAVATGIGVGRAHAAARQALHTFSRPRMVISTGVAGALVPALKAGELVIADRMLLVEEQDGGVQDASFNEVVRISADTLQIAQAALQRAGMAFATGALLTMHRVMTGAAARNAAHARSGALAVDMESAVIAMEAESAGAPFVCVRAIMDEFDDEIPGAELPDESGRVAPLKAAAYFLKNPASLALIPGVLKKLNRATGSIAAAVAAISIPSSR
jgi:adenosylhomocysteine nucleosidase